jgi:protein subunit release factor A
MPNNTSRKPFPEDLETLRKEVIIETYRSTGPGGQRKNKKETAVRLTHIPSGITAVASERRSQALNREIAFERLQAKLAELNRPKKPRKPVSPPAGAVRGRREGKRRQSEKKKLRQRPDFSSYGDIA